ncbi:MAG: DNA recombination protein RmuC [Alphaproteobacteria bacterium]
MNFSPELYTPYLPFAISALCGFVIGALIVYLVQVNKRTKLERENAELIGKIEAEKAALERASSELDNRFRATAAQIMQQSNEQFLQLAQERLKGAQGDAAHDLDKRQKAIDEMVKPVQEHLKSMASALEQVKGTDQSLREQVQNLNRETARLVGALRDPSAQGAWGEYILEGILENSGLMKDVHYETQVSFQTESGRQRPDVKIKMQDGFNIIVDAKAPINEFVQRLSEDLGEQEHDQITQKLAAQVRDHVKKLGSKNYWENIESPDFTVLFLPSEHTYSIALRSDPMLVEFAASKNVIIASPTLLMSLLRVVGMSWRQVELAHNAQEISDLGYDLYKRFLKFTDHFEKIGGHLQKAMGGYDAALGSMERQVLPAARKFKDLQGAKVGMNELPEMKAVEAMPRALNLTIDDEQEKKRA